MARLPQPGGDSGNWGDILNDFLSQAHTSDGNLKPGTVDTSRLASSVQSSLAKADSAYQKPSGGIPATDIKTADLDTRYAPIPSGTSNAGDVQVRDASAVTGVKWSGVQEPVARALGWAIITDSQWGSVDTSGGSDCSAAIAAALASGKPCVYFPAGTYLINSSITLSSGKCIVGAGRSLTTFKVGSGVTTAAFLGTSGAAVADVVLSNFTINCGWTTGMNVLAGVQITNGARIRVSDIAVKNSGGAGILLQGLGGGGGTPDSRIENCLVDGAGLSDGTTGHAIWLKDASVRSVVSRCRITNVKGGMGIGLSGAAGTGYPTYCRIADNTIDMSSSTTGFEGIGLTAGCTNAVITANTVFNTYDNGISVTASYCTVTGNNVDGTYNHGITAGGDGSQVVGNFVRNVGKENPALGFGGICLDTGAANCVVMGNRVVDDQGTHTMAYAIKINSSGGNNRIGPNSMAGWLTSAYNGLLSTDLNIDAESYANGFSFPRVYTDYLASKTVSGSISVSSAMYLTNQIVVGSGAAKTSQLTVYSNAGATRANAALSVAVGQVANVLDVYNSGGSVAASITKDGAFKPLAVATASRPTAATVGAGGMIFDTTLNKPIWSTGSVWVDASGTTV